MITISKLDKIGIDERGYTYEYFHERMGRQLVIFRKAGTISGRHYHKGISLSKNPEIILFLSGEATLNYKEAQSTVMHTVQIEAPAKIEILSFVWHEIIAVSDCTFLEMNSISEHELDTFYES